MDEIAARAQIELAKKSAVDTMEMFLRNFGHVPDDKLAWTPAPSAKSALRIAAHTALFAGRFAEMIAHRAVPNETDVARWEAEELAVQTREEAEQIFRAGTEKVLAALDLLTAEDIQKSLDSGQGWSMSMTFVMGLPGFHAALHMGQIDYLQTCWGDQQVYVG